MNSIGHADTPAPNTPVTLLGFIGASPRPDSLTGEDFDLETPYQAGNKPVTAMEITPYQKTRESRQYSKIIGNFHWGGKDGTLPVLEAGKVEIIQDDYQHWVDYVTRVNHCAPDKVVLSYIPPDSMAGFQTILDASAPLRVGEHTYLYKLKPGVKLKDTLKFLYANPALEFAEPAFIK